MMILLSLSLKVIMNSLINGLCPECYNSDIVTDDTHMINYCSRCGLVVESQDITTIRESFLQQKDIINWEIYQKLNPMSESTSNIKSVTYISYSKSNLIQILRNNSKEKEGSHTLLFLKVFIVEGVWGHYFTIFFSSYTPILYKSFTLKLYIFSKIFH